jgi:hypothetical protein
MAPFSESDLLMRNKEDMDMSPAKKMDLEAIDQMARN